MYVIKKKHLENISTFVFINSIFSNLAILFVCFTAFTNTFTIDRRIHDFSMNFDNLV